MVLRKILETLALAEKEEEEEKKKKKAAASSEQYSLARLGLVGGHGGCIIYSMC